MRKSTGILHKGKYLGYWKADLPPFNSYHHYSCVGSKIVPLVMEPTGIGGPAPLQEVSLYPAAVPGKGLSYLLTNLRTPIYNLEFKQMNKERDKGTLFSLWAS